MTFDELLAGLTSHRGIHQQWLDHQIHCAGCPDCAANVVEQVGDVETHRKHVEFYNGAIALVESVRRVGGVYFSPEADALILQGRACPEGPHISNAELILIRECVRPLDCGHLYCRYCRANSENSWQHSEHCPYADSVKKVEQARAVLDRLHGVGPEGPQQAEKEEKTSRKISTR